MPQHTFLIENVGDFLAKLEAKKYSRSEAGNWIRYAKLLSGALVKYYSIPADSLKNDLPVQVLVSYKFIDEGRPLEKIAKQLKKLNHSYRRTIDGFKTVRSPNKKQAERMETELQRFLHAHGEMIACFRYQADDRVTEGNHLFNLEIASTAKEQKVSLDFIRALVEAFNPRGITWRRRQPDKPVQQRNGWIRREADYLKQRGWRANEIAREIQKELRNGTWSQRSRLQFNIANSTVCKIAGIKIPRLSHN